MIHSRNITSQKHTRYRWSKIRNTLEDDDDDDDEQDNDHNDHEAKFS